jgi:DNA-binding phage protein
LPGFTYKSYNFADKDPIIDEIRTIVGASGASYKWIEDMSGVTQSTLYAWFLGKTKKPQAATINAVLRALGYKLAPVPSGAEIIKFTPPMPLPIKAQRTSLPASTRHVVQMAKYTKGGRKHG